MTATDELRRLLDERGVPWMCHGYENHTWWAGVGGIGWHAEERPSVNGLYVKIEAALTHAQAIAVTLGAGTCRLKRAQWDDGTCTWGCICTACDAHLEHETGIGYNFCPNCGRKVVDR